ncbi:MAG: hypothetical protein NT038_09510, partial [Euryarchaeota archaeon]|nr:hypothetical protein [Euryarchaeota archaeon]
TTVVVPQIKPVKAAWYPGKIITKYIEYKNELKNLTPFPRIMYWGGKIIRMFNPTISFAEGFKAIPTNISIGVNEKVTIRVGNVNITTGNFEPAEDRFFLADRFLTFSAKVEGGNPSGFWFVNFNPPTVSQNSARFLITNATIQLTSPPMANEPIQDTIINITIADTWVVKNLWWPERGSNTSISPLFWFVGAFIAGYGKLSGTIITEYYYVDILVKVKQDIHSH